MYESHSERLRMEAALCLWEAMLDTRLDDDAYHRSPQWQVDMSTEWANHGTVEMRQRAIMLAPLVLDVWDLLTEEEQEQCVPYDWDFVPTVLAEHWEHPDAGCLTIAANIRKLLKDKPA